MTRILVDTDLLLNNAEAIHLHAENFQKNGEALLGKILWPGDRTPISPRRRGAMPTPSQEILRSMQNTLTLKADGLAALARAFRSIDDETISTLLAMRGEGWFLQTFFPAPVLPDIAGFEPYFLPQSRITADRLGSGLRKRRPRIKTDADVPHRKDPGPRHGNLYGRRNRNRIFCRRFGWRPVWLYPPGAGERKDRCLEDTGSRGRIPGRAEGFRFGFSSGG